MSIAPAAAPGHAAPGRPTRLAVVVSHPIQYFAHLYRKLAAVPEIELKVFFGSTIGVTSYHDPGLGVSVSWECDLLGGYESEFLPGADLVRRADFKSLLPVPVGPALAGFRPDVVLLHGYSTPQVLRAWGWAAWHRTPLLLCGDGNGRTDRAKPWRRRIGKRLLLSPLLAWVDRVLTLGEANELFWRSLGVPDCRMQWAPFYIPAPETTLPPGTVREEARARVRAELGIAHDQLVVLCVGKFIPRKRTADVVRAVDLCPTAVGVYVGTGETRAACEALAATPRHRFVGFANLPRMAEFFAAADVLCHAAEREAYGLVVAEAATAGLPIVATSCTGAIGERSHGRVGENAVVFDTGDVAGAADALRTLADDPGLRGRMGQASARIAAEMEAAFVRGVLESLPSRH